VSVVSDGESLRIVSMAPVVRNGHWIAAAGVATAVDARLAATLAGITRADLILLDADGVVMTASTRVSGDTALARAAGEVPADGGVREVELGHRRYLVAASDLDDATILFIRDLNLELASLPRLRRVVAASGAGALVVVLVLGAALAVTVARPIRSLALAADGLKSGDFDAPLPASRVIEVQRVAHAFGSMRTSLAERLNELEAMNRELADRQERLTALQSELIQRERLAVSARLVTELAHEIRNPVANVRNCLELLHRRLRGDGEGQEFATLAIDELLRMHELAERMLDLNRPRDPSTTWCDAADIAREVAALAHAGRSPGELEVTVTADGDAPSSIPPDALKQVLLNLVQNAREAVPGGVRVRIAVHCAATSVRVNVDDDGPGIPSGVRAQLFQPFVTTKREAGGVGLGLFVSDGTLRRYGGAITARQESNDWGGASFEIRLRAARPITTAGAGAPATADLSA
jgi:signal transduction histidine kinase